MARKSTRVRSAVVLTLQVVLVAALAVRARADVVNYTDDDRQLWFDAVDALGTYDTITFAELPLGSVVTTPYQQEFGVTFSGGITEFSPSAFPNDSIGFIAIPLTEIRFDTPQNWFAADTPGALVIQLYMNNTLFYTSHIAGEFNGVISDMAFDAVQIFDPGDNTVAVDDIYFGTIPAPATFVLVTGFLFLCQKERRRTTAR